MIHGAENTTEQDREKSFRSIVLTARDRDSSTIVCVTAHRSENIGLYDEAPSFQPLPCAINSNHALGLLLLRIASGLLNHGSLSQMPSFESVAEDEPVPFEIMQPCAD